MSRLLLLLLFLSMGVGSDLAQKLASLTELANVPGEVQLRSKNNMIQKNLDTLKGKRRHKVARGAIPVAPATSTWCYTAYSASDGLFAHLVSTDGSAMYYLDHVDSSLNVFVFEFSSGNRTWARVASVSALVAGHRGGFLPVWDGKTNSILVWAIVVDGSGNAVGAKTFSWRVGSSAWLDIAPSNQNIPSAGEGVLSLVWASTLNSTLMLGTSSLYVWSSTSSQWIDTGAVTPTFVENEFTIFNDLRFDLGVGNTLGMFNGRTADVYALQYLFGTFLWTPLSTYTLGGQVIQARDRASVFYDAGFGGLIFIGGVQANSAIDQALGAWLLPRAPANGSVAFVRVMDNDETPIFYTSSYQFDWISNTTIAVGEQSDLFRIRGAFYLRNNGTCFPALRSTSDAQMQQTVLLYVYLPITILVMVGTFLLYWFHTSKAPFPPLFPDGGNYVKAVNPGFAAAREKNVKTSKNKSCCQREEPQLKHIGLTHPTATDAHLIIMAFPLVLSCLALGVCYIFVVIIGLGTSWLAFDANAFQSPIILYLYGSPYPILLYLLGSGCAVALPFVVYIWSAKRFRASNPEFVLPEPDINYFKYSKNPGPKMLLTLVWVLLGVGVGAALTTVWQYGIRPNLGSSVSSFVTSYVPLAVAVLITVVTLFCQALATAFIDWSLIRGTIVHQQQVLIASYAFAVLLPVCTIVLGLFFISSLDILAVADLTNTLWVTLVLAVGVNEITGWLGVWLYQYKNYSAKKVWKFITCTLHDDIYYSVGAKWAAIMKIPTIALILLWMRPRVAFEAMFLTFVTYVSTALRVHLFPIPEQSHNHLFVSSALTKSGCLVAFIGMLAPFVFFFTANHALATSFQRTQAFVVLYTLLALFIVVMGVTLVCLLLALGTAGKLQQETTKVQFMWPIVISGSMFKLWQAWNLLGKDMHAEHRKESEASASRHPPLEAMAATNLTLHDEL